MDLLLLLLLIKVIEVDKPIYWNTGVFRLLLNSEDNTGRNHLIAGPW